jgi:nucleoside-diphosphate-sugar epimerase
MKTKVLVTGGSGFVGSHLVKKLLNDGHEVAITTKYDSVYENIRLFNIWNSIKVIECDLRYSNTIKKINDFNPRVVFHLAAYNDVKGSFDNYGDSLETNLAGTANLLENLKKYDQFIYISSSEVYGHQETNSLFVETMRPFPISPYSIGKYSGELYAQMHMRQLKKPIKILRPFNIFGESQSTKAVIPELIKKFLNNQTVKITKGKQTREFNYVANTVDLLISAAKEKSFFNQIVNISDGQEISIKNLAKDIKRLSQSNAELIVGGLPERKTEIHRMKASIKKMKEKISTKKLVSFEEGLKHTINWYRDEKNIFSIF